MRADAARRFAGEVAAAGRWRHGGERLDDAVARRHSGCAGRPAGFAETTALGAAYVAGWRAGLYPGPDDFATTWRRERRFIPAMPAATRTRKIKGWREALARTLLKP